MPYTPPSHRSPASSNASSPNLSRRSSFQGPTPTGHGRPVLPRSSSYMTKHRRTPSAPETSRDAASQPTPQATSEDLKSMVPPSIVRQSPPPVTDGGMPKGAIISPPESSDDDDLPEVRGRKIENLKELHQAIRQIPQKREGSPSKPDALPRLEIVKAGDAILVESPSQAVSEGMPHSFSTGSMNELAVGHRRVSHTRSATESAIVASKSVGNSLTGSEEDSDEEMQRKPQMVRKKSGELVRPALRPSSRRRPSSMPGTPTFSKAVHFDSHLEHVRHFLQVDRPLAVSAGSSPADNYDSESEFPFSSDERQNGRSLPYEWELVVTNFPVETPARKGLMARVEKVWLSPDQKSLIGSVIVANVSFQKAVTCRFTLDYWKTTSEIAAEYVAEVQPKQTAQGHDRFHFTLKLSDLANLESKTLFFCIRYVVDGQEHWDNNNNTNYQVDFRKKMLPQNGKRGAIGAANRPANALPRSNRRGNSNVTSRPKSMPVGFDEFGDNDKVDFSQSIHDYLGESGPSSGLRLKGVRSSTSIASDNLSGRLSAPSGQAFANRYDFGASLTAAVQAAKDQMSGGKSDGLYMKPSSAWQAPPKVVTITSSQAAPTVKVPVAPVREPAPPSAVLPAIPGTDSPSAIIASSSYEELVNKYCFFGSKQSSPQIKDGTLPTGRYDGMDELTYPQSPPSSNSSAEGSPVRTGRAPIHAGGAQHHSVHYSDSNPYFLPSTTLASIHDPSPSESPLHSFSPENVASPLNQPRTASAMGSASARSSSPASLAASFQSFGGASPSEIQYQLQDRFPFTVSDSHTPAAILG